MWQGLLGRRLDWGIGPPRSTGVRKGSPTTTEMLSTIRGRTRAAIGTQDSSSTVKSGPVILTHLSWDLRVAQGRTLPTWAARMWPTSHTRRCTLSNSQDHDTPGYVDHDTTPPANRSLLTIAGVLLLLPIVALMWVSSYARIEPKLGAFPFFIWYQFLWVFLCSACTYTAYRLVLKARPHRRMTSDAPKDQEPRR
jgi:Protein of unknown function (DUF3311)